MQTTDNTILITGGGSGIGRALAERFHALGNRVIITGRRQEMLEEMAAAHPGMEFRTLDIADAAAVADFSARMRADFPELNVVINNAGIMPSEAVTAPDFSLASAEATVATNLLGPIRLTAGLLPHLMTRDRAAVLFVSSGLAFLPLAVTPTYCATKAAIHSYAQSLRFQLRETSVEVIELAPPYVQTQLQGPRQESDPNAMPLKDFIDDTMDILTRNPDVQEVLVERVHPLRFAEKGDYAAFFQRFNTMFAAGH